jgi:threonine synthase
MRSRRTGSSTKDCFFFGYFLFGRIFYAVHKVDGDEMTLLNPRVDGLSCLRCGTRYELDDLLEGCPACRKEGHTVNVKVVYKPTQDATVRPQENGMRRYAPFLPYASFPTLGEGGTPIVELEALARQLGLTWLGVKMEGQNPTGSHKDRMSPLVVARALATGRSVVTAASSGNAGASLAAYAALAGLRCVIVTTPDLPRPWKRAIEMAGAEWVIQPTPHQRWQYIEHKVRKEGWYPATNYTQPPVGSNPFGVQGYKTVAYEIVETMRDRCPDVLLVPCSRGDLLWGIWEGFREAAEWGWLKEIPRLYAVEPFPRLIRVLAGEDYRSVFPGDTRLRSIGGDTVTYQSVEPVKRSGGGAVAVSFAEAEEAQHRLARCGVDLENAGAAPLAGLQRLLRAGEITGKDRVLLIGTSHGYKSEGTP